SGMCPAAFLVEGVIANLVDVAVCVRVERLAGLALVRAAGTDVEQVRNNATTQDELAIGVAVVHAPRIARPVCKNLEVLGLGDVAPDASIQLYLLRIGLVGIGNLGVGEDAVQSVQPAVRSPLKGIERFVRVLAAEPFEENLELPRLVVLVLDEKKIGR